MNITLVTPPDEEPVTLAQVYEQLRLDAEDGSHPDDDMLRRHIKTARGRVEQLTRRSILTQELRLATSGWPILECLYPYRETEPRSIKLPRPPVASVSSVTYYDADNTLQTIAAANYFVTDDLMPRLQFVDSFSYPTTYKRDDALRILYTTGWPDVEEVPDGIKDAILIGVQLLYDRFDVDERADLERARDALLADYVIHLSA